MTHKKRQSTEKMQDYKNEKTEFAEELGMSADNTEVNAKIASQGESKFSKKTRNKKRKMENSKKK